MTVIMNISCILLKFYIKPQLKVIHSLQPRRCILLKFYIKPQLLTKYKSAAEVVSY